MVSFLRYLEALMGTQRILSVAFESHQAPEACVYASPECTIHSVLPRVRLLLLLILYLYQHFFFLSGLHYYSLM